MGFSLFSTQPALRHRSKPLAAEWSNVEDPVIMAEHIEELRVIRVEYGIIDEDV